jgi:hypothetical protein
VLEADGSGADLPFDINAVPPLAFEGLEGEYIDDEIGNDGDSGSSQEELPPPPVGKVAKISKLKKNKLSKRESQEVAFTRSNPLGRVLLGLLEDNLVLQEKLGISQSSVSAVNLCEAFYTQSLNEKTKMRAELEAATRISEQRILTTEINALSNLDEELVPHFSKHPKLLTNAASIEASRLFPTRNKFSGGSGGESPSLQEFFASLRTAQEQMRLTEREFQKMLLQSTSGKAHELCQTWLESGENVKTIFFNLSLQFDRRLSPEQARLKLTNLMASKSTDIARHISYIMSLAQRAACALPPGSSRVAYYNNEAISCLIRSLPPASKNSASNLFHTLSAKAKRAITYNELARPLVNIRDTIDQDIKMHGAGGSIVQSKINAHKSKRNGGKHTTYSVNASEELGNFQPPQYTHTQRNSHWQNKNRTHQVSHKTQGNSVHQVNANRPNNQNGNGNNFQGPPSGQRQNHNGARPKQYQGYTQNHRYCSLCGLNSHVASQGCRNMRDDQNKIVNIQPCQSVCSQCPPSVKPRLNHPAIVCPYRVGGPLYNTK